MVLPLKPALPILAIPIGDFHNKICHKPTFLAHLDHRQYRAGPDVSEALTAHYCGDDNNI